MSSGDMTQLPCINRSCPIKNTPSVPTYKCSGCGEKALHYPCFEKLILERHNLASLDGDGFVVACTNKCYHKIEKDSDDSHTYAWNKDGKEGPNDPNNSEALLLKWLMTPGNYNRYRGKDNAGKRKIQFANEIAKIMNEHGVRWERNAKQIIAKISYIENYFRW
jgi:hypothetical protein